MPLLSLTQVAEADFPTRWGHFRILGFEGIPQPDPTRKAIEGAVALIMGDLKAMVALQTTNSPQTIGSPQATNSLGALAATNGLHAPAANGNAAPPVVRIHSQCLTGDVFHSLRCDCHDQLHLALKRIAAEGAGILLYEQQEGRGIGLMAKLRAYELQDQGLDTVEANHQLGYPTDLRAFELPAAILKHLGIRAVRLITNNPDKVAALEAAGIHVTERIDATVPSEPTFERYLETKREKLGHFVS